VGDALAEDELAVDAFMKAVLVSGLEVATLAVITVELVNPQSHKWHRLWPYALFH